MSDLTKHWAWKQRLAPNLKLLLLVLSDESDDRGECGTSPVSHFAHKCCMGERTVFRLLGQLEGYGLISRSKRFQDGRQVASEYRLNLDAYHRGEIPADQVEQARTASLAGPRSSARRARSSSPASSAVRSVGTRTAELADQKTKAVVVSSTTKPGDGSDTPCSTDLIPPRSYTPEQQASALALVAHLPGPLDQLVLDEAEGYERKRLRKSDDPLRLLQGFIRSAEAKGTFEGVHGVEIARERQRRARDAKEAAERAAARARLKPADPATTKKHIEAVAAMLRTGRSA